MSEQENLEVVRKGYEAFGRGDIPGLLSLLDPQISWVTPGPKDLPIAAGLEDDLGSGTDVGQFGSHVVGRDRNNRHECLRRPIRCLMSYQETRIRTIAAATCHRVRRGTDRRTPNRASHDTLVALGHDP